MEIGEFFKNIKGTIILEIEGFYTERFINLCKTQNIDIWDIKYITSGLIVIKTNLKNFKSMKKIAKKTKCKVRIKKKKGVYFVLFKYRKRKLFAVLAIVVCLLLCILSTFILRIEVYGNNKISDKVIMRKLDEAGLSKWKNKFFIDKSKITNYLRANMYDIAWVGIKIDGTTAKLEIKEKIIENENLTKDMPGDIIASKSGVITKIIAENGTPNFLTGSYIEEGMSAISGLIPSEILGNTYVHAKGILKIKNEYNYEIVEKYKVEEKKYTKKRKYGIGINVNNKEYLLKYLPKNTLYDINKKEKTLKIFSKEVKLLFVKYSLYELKKCSRSYDNLLSICKEKYEKHIDKTVSKEAKVLDEKVTVTKESDGIRYNVSYIVEENVRSF